MFIAAVVLLINAWSSRNSRSSANVKEDMGYVHMCLNHVKACENR